MRDKCNYRLLLIKLKTKSLPQKLSHPIIMVMYNEFCGLSLINDLGLFLCIALIGNVKHNQIVITIPKT